MIFLELALQGIQGFDALTRLTLKPGINIGRSDETYKRRAILDAIYHALYPDPARAQATERLADRNAKDSRIALTFFGRDKETYRIVREAVTGAVSLHKFDKETKKYSALTRTALEVGQYLRVNQQIPDEVGFERLFVFSPETMPSKGHKAKTRSGSGLASGGALDFPSAPGRPARQVSGIRAPSVLPSALSAAASATSLVSRAASAGFGSALNPTNALVQAELGKENAPAEAEDEEATPNPGVDELEQKREQLLKLKEEMLAATRAERAQVELDALNSRKFELTGKAERARELRDEVEKLKRLADSQSDLHNLPSGFGDRLRRFEEMQAKYQTDRLKLSDERADIEDKVQKFIVLHLREDKYFIASVLFALMFVTAGISFEKAAIALLNIPCAAIAAAAAFRWVAELEKKARTEAKLTAIADRELRLERQYDLDTAALRRLMEKLEITDPRELLERIDGAEQLEKQLRAAEEALNAFRSDPQVAAAEMELEQVIKRIEGLEAEVMGAQNVISAVTLDRRVVALEREISAIETKRGIAPVKISARAMSPAPQFPPAPDLLRGSVSPQDVPRVITGDLVRAGSNVFAPYDPNSLSNIVAPLDPTKMDPVRMDPSRIDPSRIDPLRRDPSRVDPSLPNPSRPDPSRSDLRVDPLRRDPSRIDPSLPNPARPDPSRSDPRIDALRRDPSRIDPSRIDPSRIDPSRIDPSPSVRPDPLRRDPSRVDSSLPGAARPDPLRRDPSRIEVVPVKKPAPRPGSAVAPSAEAASLFDFGGGNIGGDDEDDDSPGYGGGYKGGGGGGGGGGAPGGSGASASASASGGEGDGLFAAPSNFPGSGGSGIAGGYGGGGGGDDGDALPPDRSRDLMSAAVDILQISVDALGDKMEKRLRQYLEAFTDGKIGKVEFGGRGEIAVFRKGEEDAIAYTELQGHELDLVDSAIRFTLIEACLAKVRLPLLIDDPFATFPAKKRMLLSQMLGYLGKATQIVLVTDKEDVTGNVIAL